jgi:hypothetical protein
MSYPNIYKKRYTIQFKNRDDFNKVTDWNLDELCNFDYEVGYSDMIIIFDNWDDREGVDGCIIMNHFKNYSTGVL